MADSLNGQVLAVELQVADADLLINESPPSIDEVKEAVTKLKGRKALGICSINADFPKLKMRP